MEKKHVKFSTEIKTSRSLTRFDFGLLKSIAFKSNFNEDKSCGSATGDVGLLEL